MHETLDLCRYYAQRIFMEFENFDAAHFMREYWQKKPLLLRNPWRGWANPLEPDELAGLACEAELESRLICGSDGAYAVEHGPFGAERFAALGPQPWTLLVQAVDHHVPAVAALITPFRFIPNWRIDDVMVSLAADMGGVGPHFDQYDVFLIQGLGRRRWQIGPICDADTPLLPNDDIKLLADFAATEEWVLEPGDILYVPPGYAHNGVAVGDDCMTYSVGFRAPSRAELLGHYVDDISDTMPEDDRYADPELQPQLHPGEITDAALARLQDMVVQAVSNKASFARWFGMFNTTPKYPDMDWRPDSPIDSDTVRAAITNGVPFARNPASRLAFIRDDAGALTLFADGADLGCAAELAPLVLQLCDADSGVLDPAFATSEQAVELLTYLCNHGCLAFEDDD